MANDEEISCQSENDGIEMKNENENEEKREIQRRNGSAKKTKKAAKAAKKSMHRK
jgi:lipocalin